MRRFTELQAAALGFYLLALSWALMPGPHGDAFWTSFAAGLSLLLFDEASRTHTDDPPA